MESEPRRPEADPESERPPIPPDLPARPERPARPAGPPQSAASPQIKEPASASVVIGGSLAGLALLSFVLLLCSGGNLFVLIASGGIFAFAAMHYIVWGWWLGRMIHEEEQNNQQADRSDP